MAVVSWYFFKNGENITADTLNTRIQDNIISALRVHEHSVDPKKAYTAEDTFEQGPQVWSDFISIKDIAGRMNALNISARDHVLDESIHNTGSSASTIFSGSNSLGFSVISPSEWKWTGHFWEATVGLPTNLYTDCGYIVYFQPTFAGSYTDFYQELAGDSANFMSL